MQEEDSTGVAPVVVAQEDADASSAPLPRYEVSLPHNRTRINSHESIVSSSSSGNGEDDASAGGGGGGGGEGDGEGEYDLYDDEEDVRAPLSFHVSIEFALIIRFLVLLRNNSSFNLNCIANKKSFCTKSLLSKSIHPSIRICPTSCSTQRRWRAAAAP
jgi:hypothetical protein